MSEFFFLRQSEEFQLFLPGEWEVGVEFGKGARARHFPGHDRSSEEMPDAGHVYAQGRQRFRRIELAVVKQKISSAISAI